ncbi:MAG: asparagine synthase-related protein [Azonexus sp.]|nr:asparagine synthase-related protein [Azonexus sp.]MDZ4315964.1 asparagine synthase-related protein [Azonexus sp.]
MIIFVGEISLVGAPVANVQPSEVIKNGVWKTFTAHNASIHVCDFSPLKDTILETEDIALATSGQPVIEQVATEKNAQLRYIADALAHDKVDLLNSANGVFCGFMLEKTSGTLKLFTDYLGLRQIYLYHAKDRLIFSNAYWLIKSSINEDLTLNIDGIVELGTLGHALANRTQFNEIELLPPGEVMIIGPQGKIENHQYFDLTKTPPSTISENEAVIELYEILMKSVKERCASANKAFGFLSGGMDSRLLVHTLKSLGIEMFTANFAPLETRDRVFGEMAAHAIDVHHFQHPNGTLLGDVLIDTVEAWQASNSDHNFFSESPYIWSGDGGSVGLGHVYLTDAIEELAASGNFASCAEMWIKSNNRNIPQRIYQDKNIEQKFCQRISKLLESYGSINPARAPYYFLMFNDQRRHLDRHYEIFHKRAVDFQLPFFDKRLIRFIASLPPKWLNNHRLYDKLYKQISGSLISTPWQTYPEHVPCLLPYPNNLKYQWSDNFHAAHEERKIIKTDAMFCLRAAISASFPEKLFNRLYILIGSLATLVNLTNHSYIRKFIEASIKK